MSIVAESKSGRTTDIQDSDGLVVQFPQLRAALPSWVNEVSLLEVGDSFTAFSMEHELGDIVTLWGSGNILADGSIVLCEDGAPDILFGKSGEINADSIDEAVETARSIADSLRIAVALLTTTPKVLRRDTNVTAELSERDQ